MNVRNFFLTTTGALCFLLFVATHLVAQEPPPPPPPPAAQQAPMPEGGRGRGMGRPGVFGKITAINDQSLQIATRDGETVTVKITGDTQFRKDREAAKLGDFKVGDMVGIRGDENPDHTWTAQMIGARPNGGFGGGPGANAGPGEGRLGGGPGGPGMRQQLGVLGQDYLAGEIKSIDPPSLTILRPDNVTQSVQLDENTSLRKGRESITMADIQAGDHVFIRGGLVNHAFQPKNVMIISPEQWKRMQENGALGGANGANTPPAKPPQPQDNSGKPQNPSELR